MRVLTLATSLALLSTPSVWGIDIVPDMRYSRLFGLNAVHTLDASSSSSPSSTSASASDPWTTGYGFTTNNLPAALQGFNLPLPPHTLNNFTTDPLLNNKVVIDPLPVGERYSSLLVFGAASKALGTIPLIGLGKRTANASLPYNNTAFTSVDQFPKVGAGLLTSIDIFDDEFFGIIHLNGPNPAMIKRIYEISPKFGPVETLLDKYKNKHSKYGKLENSLRHGQIYELDYAQLANVTATTLAAPANSILAYPQHPNPGPQPRYITAPYVLLQFVKENGCDKLVPIAIQLNQTYVAGSTAVLYRVDYKDEDGNAINGVDQGDWNYAKTIVNSADAIIHQLDAHLVKTHLIAENVIIGTHVKLPQNHVISRLLIGGGHSLKTLQINEDARNSLVPGIVDEVFAGGYGGAGVLIDTFFASYNYQDDYIPTDLSNRGFDSQVPYRYYYAQDAKNSWSILLKFVKTVLKARYPNDKAVAQDKDLQAWAAYLSTPQFGLPTVSLTKPVPAAVAPVPGFPSSFTTFDSLADAVTAALYKSTVGHSVVNYPQPFYNAYIPVYPTLALYRPILNATTLGTGLTTDAYIAAALGNANTQYVMTTLVDGLGQPVAASGLPDDITLLQYAVAANAVVPDRSDAIAVALKKGAQNLLNELNNLSKFIKARDDSNPEHYRYGYFDPSRVANAIFA